MQNDKPPIIQAEQLTRRYRFGDSHVVGLNRVDLTINAGDVAVLKGNSGSGKSTLLSLLAGLDQPTSGELRVADHDLKRARPADLTRFRRKTVGMVFQSFNLLPTLNVLENVCLPALLAGDAYDPVRARARTLLEWLNLDKRLDHLPAQLSGGEMQRTAIARALINDPAIILADEPTGNLDSKNGQAVIDLLAELNRTQGRTVVIATHSAIADPVAAMQICLKDGEITELTCDI